MVSISQSLTELDAAYRMRMAALECYRSAVQSAGQYAVDFETSLTEAHRKDLESLAVEIAGSQNDDTLARTVAHLRASLRDYRDRASAFLANLRRELAEKATSLEQIFQSLADGDGEHELRIGRTIRALRDLASRPEAAKVRGPLGDAAAALDESLEEMKRQHQLTVAQFLVEVRILHQRIQELETSPNPDGAAAMPSRKELESRIEGAIAAREPFSLLMLRTRNLAGVLRQFPDVDGALLTAFAKRLQNCLKPDDVVARWSDDRFVVLQPGGKQDAVGAVRRIAEHVGGVYVIRLGERLVRPALQLTVGTVEGRSSESRGQLVARVESFFEAMA